MSIAHSSFKNSQNSKRIFIINESKNSAHNIQIKHEENTDSKIKSNIYHSRATIRPEIIFEKTIDELDEEEDLNSKKNILQIHNHNKQMTNSEKNLKNLKNLISKTTFQNTIKLIKFIDVIILLLILLNIYLSITENNLFTLTTEEINGEVIKYAYHVSSQVNLLRYMCILVCFIIDILLTTRYYFHLKVMRSKQLACASDGLISTGLWKNFIIEIIFLSLFSPPYMETTISGRMLGGSFTYSIDSIINFFLIFKLYYVIKVFQNFSIFLSDFAEKIAMSHKFYLSTEFAIKSQLKKRPYFSVIFIFVLFLSIFSITIRTFEYGYNADQEMEEGTLINGKVVINPDFESYIDSFWMVVITMLTVGFGDIHPHTHSGRLIAFLSAAIGLFLSSLLIVSLNNLMELKPEENKAICLLKYQDVQDRLHYQASNVVKVLCNLNMLKNNQNFMERFISKRKISYKKKIKISVYFTQIFILRCMQIKFLKELNLSQTISLPSDDILRNLTNKFNDDCLIISKQKSELNMIKNLTLKINKDEQDIFTGMKNIKCLQDEIAEFLVRFNNKMNSRSRKESGRTISI
jgi:hypothetical protein